MKLNNQQKIICELYNIKYPIIQGGMVWISGGKLAAAVANSGCLGLIGAGSMKPELLKEHIKKAQSLSSHKTGIGVNIPLLYKYAQEQIDTALELGIKNFFTSAGSPKKFTKYLKDNGATVTHVTSSPLLAKKCEDAGVDAIVAEGFEAGGHNGRDEITTMCLIPQVVNAVSIPVIAAGGIGNGATMAAATCLGAWGVQMGTRFMMSKESSAHQNYKQVLTDAKHDATMLSMKAHVPVRLIKNKFFHDITDLENKCAPVDEIVSHLGKGRARQGMLEGEMNEGELEAGQICGAIDSIESCQDIVNEIISEYELVIKQRFS
jgi:enoyl-[acyl-carrier protein] reductase II